MTPARFALSLLVLAIALAPFPLHWTVISPHCARSGHHVQIALSLIGALAWYVVWLHALPIGRRPS